MPPTGPATILNAFEALALQNVLSPIVAPNLLKKLRTVIRISRVLNFEIQIEIEEDDITTFKLKGQDREYKHYELLKIEKIEKNPYARVADSFDVEQNLDQARRNREGPREPVQHRPSTRFEEQTRIGLAAKKWSRGPSEAQKEEISKLKTQLVDTQFIDDGIKWKIIDVKWNGKYRQIMVYYYDVDKYSDVPSLKNQEYTPIHVIRDILKENKKKVIVVNRKKYFLIPL